MVDEFVVSVGANPGGAIEGQREPRIIFAFVSPERKREEHLHFLASLARLSQNRELVERIASANEAEDVIAALRAAGL
jgi:mannitol/fructose-specific phosphotransferase system IIA component (Ntr-type)